MRLTRDVEMQKLLIADAENFTKIDIASRRFSNWSENIEFIATETMANVTLSGLMTDASDNWTVVDLNPV